MRLARERLGVSQAELGRLLRARGFAFPQQTIRKLETGLRDVRLNEAIAISEVLGFKLADVFRPPIGDDLEELSRFALALMAAADSTQVLDAAYGWRICTAVEDLDSSALRILDQYNPRVTPFETAVCAVWLTKAGDYLDALMSYVLVRERVARPGDAPWCGRAKELVTASRRGAARAVGLLEGNLTDAVESTDQLASLPGVVAFDLCFRGAESPLVTNPSHERAQQALLDLRTEGAPDGIDQEAP